MSAVESKLAVRQPDSSIFGRSISVTSERACSICHKRIGTAAFVAYPKGMLGHFSCHQRTSGRTNSRDLAQGRALPARVYDISS